jgi:Terminase DNA packaging enzyme
MSKFDQKMSEFFDVEPISSNTDLSTVNSTEIIPHETLDVDFKNDYIKVRENFQELLQKGNDAVDDILSIARESEKARDFEVAANLLKSMLDANEQLITIHKKVRDIANYKQIQSPDQGQTTIKNALFVGSTTELTKLVKDLNNKDIIEGD